MPHLRERHLKSLLVKSMKFSPITGVFGHRQVGKSTLANLLAQRYVTLDLPDELAASSANPEAFLIQNQALPLVIDECQLSPKLFPVLKEWVRQKRKPGQFLLTGSVRFSSRKAIRESLTGRLIAWELLPMDWAEQNSLALSEAIPKLLATKKIDIQLPHNPDFNRKSYEAYLQFGGLPGLFALRDEAIRAQKLETQINTTLERDLRLLIETTLPYKSLRRVLESLAKQNGQVFSAVQLSKETRVSLPTLRKLISAFEALFLIRFLPVKGDFVKPIIYFEDLAECRYLQAERKLDDEEDSLRFFLYQNLRAQVHYRPELKVSFFAYREQKSFDMPLCFAYKDRVVGILPLVSSEKFPQAFAQAKNFVKIHKDAFVLIVQLDPIDEVLGPNLRRVGVGSLL